MTYTALYDNSFLRFHGTGSIWNRSITGTIRACVSTGPVGTVPFGSSQRFQMGPLTK